MSHISIRVSTLRGAQKIDFDVFLKINDKMVLYLRRGDSFEGLRLKRLKEKKLKNLHILVDDEANYLKYLKTNIDSAYDPNSKREIQSRAEVIQGDQQSHVEIVFEHPEDKKAYEDTREASLKYVDFLMKNVKATQAVLNIENSDKSLSHHGVTVGTLAVALSQKMQLTDPKVNHWLTLGGLLHDIGLHEIKANYSQPLDLLSNEDRAIYRSHPIGGIEKIKSTTHFDTQVIRIITEHEECIDGSGFPKGLAEQNLDPLSTMVGSCNAMDRLITFEGVSKLDAPKKLMIDKVGKYPLNQIKIIGEIIKAL